MKAAEGRGEQRVVSKRAERSTYGEAWMDRKEGVAGVADQNKTRRRVSVIDVLDSGNAKVIT